YLQQNIDIKGQVLTNKSLEKCYYNKNYNLCVVKEVKCELLTSMDEYSLCSNNTIEEKESTNGKCGKDYGKCPSGQCCSNGKCGSSTDYCYLSKGCDLSYGMCYNECRELADHIESKNNDYGDIISECKIDSKGYVKQLYIYGFEIQYTDKKYQTIVDEVSKLTSLEDLTLFSMEYDGLNLDGLKNLTKLTSFGNLKEIPEFIYSLTSLKRLYLESQKITDIPDSLSKLENLDNFRENEINKFPSVLSKLKSLEYINLEENNIYSVIPKELNELPKLKEIYLNNNINIMGKMLTNKSLEKCSYSDKYDICWDKSVKCINYKDQKEYLNYNECTDEYNFNETENDECKELINQLNRYVVIKCFPNKEGHIKNL
ncbi:carbohydrate-binding module family 18 protein, partial [Piromyces sp. E2]